MLSGSVGACSSCWAPKIHCDSPPGSNACASCIKNRCADTCVTQESCTCTRSNSTPPVDYQDVIPTQKHGKWASSITGVRPQTNSSLPNQQCPSKLQAQATPLIVPPLDPIPESEVTYDSAIEDSQSNQILSVQFINKFAGDDLQETYEAFNLNEVSTDGNDSMDNDSTDDKMPMSLVRHSKPPVAWTASKPKQQPVKHGRGGSTTTDAELNTNLTCCKVSFPSMNYKYWCVT